MVKGEFQIKSSTSRSAAATCAMVASVEVGERSFDQAPIVDRAKLIDEQVGGAAKRGLRGHADAQRFGIVYEIRG